MKCSVRILNYLLKIQNSRNRLKNILSCNKKYQWLYIPACFHYKIHRIIQRIHHVEFCFGIVSFSTLFYIMHDLLSIRNFFFIYKRIWVAILNNAKLIILSLYYFYSGESLVYLERRYLMFHFWILFSKYFVCKDSRDE